MMYPKIFVCVLCVLFGCGLVVRRIWVSDEVYELLLKRKGDRTFSQVIEESLCPKKKKGDIMRFAGILADDKEALERLKRQIADERDANYGRSFE
jgi:predicted CopG family antitoxin